MLKVIVMKDIVQRSLHIMMEFYEMLRYDKSGYSPLCCLIILEEFPVHQLSFVEADHDWI